MSTFAKIHDSEKYGQILVKIDQADGDSHIGPEVRFYFEPKGLGVCSLAMNYNDTDSGWDAAEKFFSGASLEKSESVIGITSDKLSGFSCDNGKVD